MSKNNLDSEIFLIQESIEDYSSNFASKKESKEILEKWGEIKEALHLNKKVKNINIIYFALMSYCEDSISEEQERIELINNAWFKIKETII